MTHDQFRADHYLPKNYPIFKNRKGQEFILAGVGKRTVGMKTKWIQWVQFVKTGEVVEMDYDKLKPYSDYQFRLMDKKGRFKKDWGVISLHNTK